MEKGWFNLNMIEIKGKYSAAKIFTDIVDNESINQVKNLCNQEFSSDSKIRMMPDIHAGAGCTIGTTMTITDKIVPNLVGVDIGCGVLVGELEDNDVDYAELDRVIKEFIPSGFNIHDIPILAIWKEHPLYNLHCKDYVDLDRAFKSLGTLGGGNHFIEVDEDSNGAKYLLIHSGSRHLGLEVAKYYQDLAYNQLKKMNTVDRKEIINQLKKEGHQREIENILKNAECSKPNSIMKDFAYLQGVSFNNYLDDMRLVQEYADSNRKVMLGVLNGMGFRCKKSFTTIHNYIDIESMILRKGAVSAKKGEKLIIPINMRDGSLICIGKGNSDWNYSAPHGAGRLMSRSKAKKQFSMSEFTNSMKSVFTTCVCQETLDECPMAYKDIDDIIANIGDTVKIEKIIKPIYNFKAH